MPVSLRILVTRPQPSAAVTAARLEAMGHQIVLLPVMEAIHQPQAALDALAHPHSAIAVTSAEVFRALAPYKAQLAPHLQTTVYCVGPATAQAARHMGFQSVVAGSGTGVSLAQIAAAASSDLTGGLVYLAGWPRSPAFEAGLQAAGIACRTAETYRMSTIAHAPEAVEQLLHPPGPDVALLYSHETARHFFALLPPQIARSISGMRLLCLSQHVANAIPPGFGPVAIAAEPSEEALLALL
ncbi:uroporphyrinogen-III synthase [Pararhizobium sp. DWP1-1-3]|uniref:uroporphyrinogen-III synthase n=1 Tax=Pararhizobium sp. DWP1-1-3 TaxID=2804652 RepID=UPI003CF19DBB